MNFEFMDIFLKHTNIKFSENPSRREPSCFLRAERQTDMMKLIVAFRNFAKSLNKNRKNFIK